MDSRLPELRALGELRALEGRRVAGVAMRYHSLGSIPGGRREMFLAGSFGTRLPPSMDLTLQHDPSAVVGHVDLLDSPEALRASGEVTEGVHSLIRRRALGGLSIEFRALRTDTRPHFGAAVRVIERADLLGLSVVDRGAYAASRVEARQAATATVETTIRTGVNIDCKCPPADASTVRFERGAFNGVEDREVTAISRGAESVVASTANGSMSLRSVAGGLSVRLSPLDTEAGRRTTELMAAGVNVFARPLWTVDASDFEIVDGVAVVAAATFAYLLVRPVPEDDAKGIDPLAPVEGAGEDRHLVTRSRRRLLLGAA